MIKTSIKQKSKDNFKPMKHKTTFLVFSLFLLLSFGASLRAQQFEGGITGGIAGSQVNGDALGGYEKAGLAFGPYVKLSLTPKSSLQMQLEYFQKGSRSNPDSTNNFQSYLLRLNYLQIPVYYQYKYNDFFGFHAGLSYGVLIHNYEERNGYEVFTPQYPFENRDLSAHAGIHWFATEQLSVKLEVAHSLLYIREQTEGTLWFFNQGQYNHYLLLALQYQIQGIFN